GPGTAGRLRRARARGGRARGRAPGGRPARGDVRRAGARRRDVRVPPHGRQRRADGPAHAHALSPPPQAPIARRLPDPGAPRAYFPVPPSPLPHAPHRPLVVVRPRRTRGRGPRCPPPPRRRRPPPRQPPRRGRPPRPPLRHL